VSGAGCQGGEALQDRVDAEPECVTGLGFRRLVGEDLGADELGVVLLFSDEAENVMDQRLRPLAAWSVA
jgi:hypothetical protein